MYDSVCVDEHFTLGCGVAVAECSGSDIPPELFEGDVPRELVEGVKVTEYSGTDLPPQVSCSSEPVEGLFVTVAVGSEVVSGSEVSFVVRSTISASLEALEYEESGAVPFSVVRLIISASGGVMCGPLLSKVDHLCLR